MKNLLPIICLALVSVPTLAASVIATPALKPPSGGSLRCMISNKSSTKDLHVKLVLYGFDGVAQATYPDLRLGPLHNLRSGSGITIQSTCVATVLKGSKANLRVALVAEDSSNNLVAAVQGQ